MNDFLCSAHHLKLLFSDDALRLDVLKKPHDVSLEPLAYTSDNEFHPAYVPPEASPDYWDTYDPLKADSWCAGILLYQMVVGRFPFYDESPENLTRRICEQPLTLPNHLSESLKSLLFMLLNKKWEERLAIEHALFHPWVKNAQIKNQPSIQTLFS